MSEFRVTGSELVADGGFITMARVTVEGHGQTLERTVVHHPGAVAVVAVEPDRETAVLVRQFRVAVGGDLLEIVAGKRDVDGEAPDITARRELEEEIGETPGSLVKLAEYYNSPGFSDEYSYLFLALDCTTVEGTHAVTAEEEQMTVERIRFADVDAMIARGEINDAKTILGLSLARRYLAGEYPGFAG